MQKLGEIEGEVV
jgi:hypothetical protein